MLNDTDDIWFGDACGLLDGKAKHIGFVGYSGEFREVLIGLPLPVSMGLRVDQGTQLDHGLVSGKATFPDALQVTPDPASPLKGYTGTVGQRPGPLGRTAWTARVKDEQGSPVTIGKVTFKEALTEVAVDASVADGWFIYTDEPLKGKMRSVYTPKARPTVGSRGSKQG